MLHNHVQVALKSLSDNNITQFYGGIMNDNYVLEIIKLFIPIVTFAMGYFLTNIRYKRERKLSITREKFEKLYHPFYMLMNELGTDEGEGLAFDVDNKPVLKQFFDHLMTNIYLASSKGQQHFWETRKLFLSYSTENGATDKEKKQLLEEAFGKLFMYLLQEYVKHAQILGYELGIDFATGIQEN